MSDLDRPAPYRGPNDRVALVEGVIASEVLTVETDWLEVKGEADLTTKAWQGEVATHILGFANRIPERAARVVGGYSYIVIGAEPGDVRGGRQFDPAVLEDWIGRYVGRGDAGPPWEPFYIIRDGVPILVIVVDPPAAGTRPWPLRKAFTTAKGKTIPDGRLFTRRGGKTVEANADEVDQLYRRAAPATRTLQIDVATDGPAEIVPIDLSPASVDRWLALERARLLDPLPPPGSVHTSTLMRAIGPAETRTRSEYATQVENYLNALRTTVRDHAIHRAMAAGHGVVRLHVLNQTDDNFAQVAVILAIGGATRAFYDEDEAEPPSALPTPPRPWGAPMRYITTSHASRGVRPPRLGSGSIEDSDGAHVSFGPVDVRPGLSHPLDEILVMAAGTLAGQQLEARWSATSTSVSGIAEGTVTLQVAEKTLDISDLMLGEDG